MNNLLDFKNYNEWVSNFKIVFDKFNHENFVLRFKNSDCSIEINDIKKEYGEEIFIEVRNFFIKNYNFIVLYHGTTTNNVNSFLDNGLLLGNFDRIVKFAKDLYPDINEKEFDIAINKFKKDTQYIQSNEGKIYFSLDDDLLKKRDSTFLVFGSETLFCLLQEFDVIYAQQLKKKLKPLILKCKVDIKKLNTNDIDFFIHNITIRYLENLIYPNEKFGFLEFTPYITTKLTADSILGLEFPQNIKCCHPLY